MKVKNSIVPLFAVHVPPEVDKEIIATLHSGYIGQGLKVEEFEKALQNYLETKNLLTVNSGTSSIHLALRLAGVGPGDEVISTPMTCAATNLPVLAHYAKIIWADVDGKNGLIDPQDIEKKITKKTKAIVCVDWGGIPCDLEPLMKTGRKHKIKIIEDAAHALGAKYKNKKVGTIANFTCFSLQAIKHITTVDGGILATKKTGDFQKGKILRWYGIDRSKPTTDTRIEIDIKDWGYKFHMNDVAATMGIVQMQYIEKILKSHRDNANFYDQNIKNQLIYRPEISWKCLPSYWLYTILLPSSKIRDKFFLYMKNSGVMVSRVHSRNDTHTVFKEFKSSLPGVEEFDSRQISIPVHWKLSENQREKITELCNKFFG